MTTVGHYSQVSTLLTRIKTSVVSPTIWKSRYQTENPCLLAALFIICIVMFSSSTNTAQHYTRAQVAPTCVVPHFCCTLSSTCTYQICMSPSKRGQTKVQRELGIRSQHRLPTELVIVSLPGYQLLYSHLFTTF